MPRLILYEINTRCWLRRLSDRAGRLIRLGDIPETEFEFWKRVGVTHLWLMGVWTTGPKSREAYLNLPDTRDRLQATLPGWQFEDVTASPYAIQSYTVPEQFGGDASLARFRQRLRNHDIRLILDFVPNHVGLDHPWLDSHPDWFVQSSEPAPGFFSVETAGSMRWIAHGKDPYFPPWIDTAQLDLRLAETQQALIENLRSILHRCDGVRCDMAMLALKDVFAANWRQFPSRGATTDAEFWPKAISAVRQDGFLLIAEAYWDLESRLIEMGFDFAYDKRVTDFLIASQWPKLGSHLGHQSHHLRRHSVHFLENHDEPRIANRISIKFHTLAVFLMSALPGMWLIHDGQLRGARAHAPIQLARLPAEPVDSQIATLYQDLLAAWKRANVAEGNGRILVTTPLLAIHWTTPELRHIIAAINGGDTAHNAAVKLPPDPVPIGEWTARILHTNSTDASASISPDPATIAVRLPARTFALVELIPSD